MSSLFVMRFHYKFLTRQHLIITKHFHVIDSAGAGVGVGGAGRRSRGGSPVVQLTYKLGAYNYIVQ